MVTNAVRMWGKENSYLLLAGMLICAVTMEISTEAPQKAETRTSLWPIHLSGTYQKDSKSIHHRSLHIHVDFYTNHNGKCNQSRCLWTDEWIKKVL